MRHVILMSMLLGAAVSGVPAQDTNAIYWNQFRGPNGRGVMAAAQIPVEFGPDTKVLARNDFGEEILATPAIADNRLYVRTARHLYAIGD